MLLQAVEGRICLSSLGWVFGAFREDLEPYLEKILLKEVGILEIFVDFKEVTSYPLLSEIKH